jgi:hypothetical protein
MFGVFVDKSDGVTLKTDGTTITDIDHAATGIFLSKNGGTAVIRHADVTASVADAYGMMQVTLDTTDTNTLGRLDVLFAKAATYLPVFQSYCVIPADLYDTLFAAQPTAAIKKFFNMASPTGTVNSLPDAVPGANGGLPTTNGTKVSQTVDLTASQTIQADLTTIHGTALTETSGQLAAGFKKFFDVATPVLTCESVNQVQDNATTAEIKTAIEAAGSHLALILEDTGTTLDALVKDIPTNTELAAATIATVTDLTNAPTAGDFTATMKTSLATAMLAAGGSGGTTWTYTLTDADTAAPIAGATIWITSDLAGTTVIASGVTNASGVATFSLTNGATIYVWRLKSGYSFVNPDQETVS